MAGNGTGPLLPPEVGPAHKEALSKDWIFRVSSTPTLPAPWPPSPSTWLPPSGSSILLGLGCYFQQVRWGLLTKGDQLSSLGRFLLAPQKGSLRRTRPICLEPRPSWTPAQTGGSIFPFPGPRNRLGKPLSPEKQLLEKYLSS